MSEKKIVSIKNVLNDVQIDVIAVKNKLTLRMNLINNYRINQLNFEITVHITVRHLG